MSSPFCTKPELKKLTGTDNAREQIRVLKSYGLHPYAPNGSPVIYRDVVMDAMRAQNDSDVDMNLDALNA